MGADMQQLALSVTVSVPLPGRSWSWGRSRPRSPASLRWLTHTQSRGVAKTATITVAVFQVGSLPVTEQRMSRPEPGVPGSESESVTVPTVSP